MAAGAATVDMLPWLREPRLSAAIAAFSFLLSTLHAEDAATSDASAPFLLAIAAILNRTALTRLVAVRAPSMARFTAPVGWTATSQLGRRSTRVAVSAGASSGTPRTVTAAVDACIDAVADPAVDVGTAVSDGFTRQAVADITAGRSVCVVLAGRTDERVTDHILNSLTRQGSGLRLTMSVIDVSGTTPRDVASQGMVAPGAPKVPDATVVTASKTSLVSVAPLAPPADGAVFEKVKRFPVSSSWEASSILRYSYDRAVGGPPPGMNPAGVVDESHLLALFTVQGAPQPCTFSCLRLAGPRSTAGGTPGTLKRLSALNSSFLQLATCASQVGAGGTAGVPFRASAVTRALRPVLAAGPESRCSLTVVGVVSQEHDAWPTMKLLGAFCHVPTFRADARAAHRDPTRVSLQPAAKPAAPRDASLGDEESE